VDIGISVCLEGVSEHRSCGVSEPGIECLPLLPPGGGQDQVPIRASGLLTLLELAEPILER
jgi:hypothetical protein